MEVYVDGTVVTFSAEFTNTTTGILADPSAVTFSYYLDTYPDAIVYIYYADLTSEGDVVRDGTGLYHIDIDTTNFAGGSKTPGVILIVQFAGQGNVQVSASEPVTIVAPPMPLLFS